MRKESYELFGRTINLPKTERESLAQHLTGWITLHDFMASLKNNDEDTILKLIIIESEGPGRAHIMRRLHSRCVTVRRHSELKELGID